MRLSSRQGPILLPMGNHLMLSAILLLLAMATQPPVSATQPARDSINAVEPRESYIYELEYWKVKNAADSSLPSPQPGALSLAGRFPDSSWTGLAEYQGNTLHGPWYVATFIAISDSAPPDRYFALLPDRIVSAFELYWDGILVASNGTVSSNLQGEKPGKYFSVIQIPRTLARRGIHTVALRISNWHMRSRWENGQFFFGYYDSIIRLIFAWQIRIYFLLGVVFLALLLNLFLFFTSHGRLANLFFGLICLVFFLSLLLNYLWAVSDVSATYLDFRNIVVPVIVLVVGIILPIFFLFEFAFPFKTAVAITITFLNLLLFLWPGRAEVVSERLFYSLAGAVLVLAVWGTARKREGAPPVLLGSAISGIVSAMNLRFGLDNLTIFCSIIILCYTYILAKRFSVGEKAKRDALLRSVTLENLLLKRTINPHYLLNSLTSITAWLRKEPAVAIRLVEALSEEFRIVTQISTLERVPMEKEIELCQTHLRIMSYRKKSCFSLELVDLDPREKIPPMIFHTLIENGITHGYENRTSGRFVLRRHTLCDGIRYTLFNDGSAGSNGEPEKTGTGMNYIRARLEESYPGRWSLERGNTPDGYCVTVTVYHHARKK